MQRDVGDLVVVHRDRLRPLDLRRHEYGDVVDHRVGRLDRPHQRVARERVVLRPGDKVSEVQGEPNHEGLIVEVDQVLLAHLGDHAAHEFEVRRVDVILDDLLDRLALTRRNYPCGQQFRQVLKVDIRESHVEMRADESGETERDRLALGVPRMRRHGERAVVAKHPVDGDRDVQQHAVDAVLVDEVALAVEHLDEVGLEEPQVF